MRVQLATYGRPGSSAVSLAEDLTAAVVRFLKLTLAAGAGLVALWLLSTLFAPGSVVATVTPMAASTHAPARAGAVTLAAAKSGKPRKSKTYMVGGVTFKARGAHCFTGTTVNRSAVIECDGGSRIQTAGGDLVVRSRHGSSRMVVRRGGGAHMSCTGGNCVAKMAPADPLRPGYDPTASVTAETSGRSGRTKRSATIDLSGRARDGLTGRVVGRVEGGGTVAMENANADSAPLRAHYSRGKRVKSVRDARGNIKTTVTGPGEVNSDYSETSFDNPRRIGRGQTRTVRN